MKKYRYSAVIWLAAVLMAGAKTIYVATDGDDARTGQTDWTNAVLTISNGVAKATAENDLVLVSNGKYGVSAQIDVLKPITVRSWNNGIVDPTNTIINGNASVKGFYISHTGAVVEGFTIINGAVGVQIWDGGTLRNCIVISNVSAGAGGGYICDARVAWWRTVL